MARKGKSASGTNRRITLCRICNFGGRKNNKLVTCALCLKKVHTSSSCSTTYVPPNNDSNDETAKSQAACLACLPGTAKARVSMACHSAIQPSPRSSLPPATHLAALISHNMWRTNRRYYSLSTSRANTSAGI